MLQNKIAAFFLCSIVFLAGCAAPTATPRPTSTATATETSIPATVTSPTVTAVPTWIGLDSTPTPAGRKEGAAVVQPETVEVVPGGLNVVPVNGEKMYSDLMQNWATGPANKAYMGALGVHSGAELVAAAAKYAKEQGQPDGTLWLPESVTLKDGTVAHLGFLQNGAGEGLAYIGSNVAAEQVGHVDITEVNILTFSSYQYQQNVDGIKDKVDALLAFNKGSDPIHVGYLGNKFSPPSAFELSGFLVDKDGKIYMLAGSIKAWGLASIQDEFGIGQDGSSNGSPTERDTQLISAMIDALIRGIHLPSHTRPSKYVYIQGEGAQYFMVERQPGDALFTASPDSFSGTNDLFAVSQ